MAGILAYGAYVPRLRLQRSAILQAHAWFNPALKGVGRGERAVANWDEDAVTMAVEAARDCVAAADRLQIGTVLLASTSAPFADRQNAGIVKEALNLPDAVMTIDVAGSQKAGTGALIQALKTTPGNSSRVLCIASERPRNRPASEGEITSADAAGAMLLGEGDAIASFIGSYSYSADFVDHFRSDGKTFDYGWEGRWIRDEGYVKLAGHALDQALKLYAISPGAVTHLIVPIPVKGVGETLARKAGIEPTALCDNVQSSLGHAGAAQPLVLLAHALKTAKPGDIIVLLGFGQGCDVLMFEVTPAILSHRHPVGVDGWLARRQPETNYLKCLFFAGQLDLELGMRAELDRKQPLTALYRNRKTVLSLVGGRCKITGEVQFPRTPISVGAKHAVVGTQEDYPLADVPAHILTCTSDSLTYTPDPPNHYGMIAFEGGGRMLTEFTDVHADAVAVGARVRMVFRIKAVDEQRDFTRYFWKATITH